MFLLLNSEESHGLQSSKNSVLRRFAVFSAGRPVSQIRTGSVQVRKWGHRPTGSGLINLWSVSFPDVVNMGLNKSGWVKWSLAPQSLAVVVLGAACLCFMHY
ncbi:hypothetical protein K2173_027969 [Erythroxylum novogranatense]|uniref:Uncharacterized protein n=1 Tax=Erythroxylum novogranatense TaxID=1862640 RepID=A0AAV8U0G1_9ROSI|nr:hypothetical protein K2173_027969 [Erythroxylum novogranatense]